MTGVPDGSGNASPSKRMGKLVVFQSLLRRRYRSLFLVPSLQVNSHVVKEGVYQLLVHISAKRMGFLTHKQLKLGCMALFWYV